MTVIISVQFTLALLKARVAQLVEQNFEAVCVVGSSPIAGKFYPKIGLVKKNNISFSILYYSGYIK